MINKPYKRRTRKFLYEDEIKRVLDLCCHTKYPDRNKILILFTYNHAFRAGEVCNLKWDNIDFDNNHIDIISQKGGVNSVHLIEDGEKELLINLYENRNKNLPYVFTSERNAKFEPQNFYRLTLKLGKMARFNFILTPHMLRHSKATFLANKDINIFKIKSFLRHKRISSTEMYIHMAANQFKNINDGSIFA
jgi:integrase